MMVKLQELESKLALGAPSGEAREQRVQKLIDTLKTLSARKAAPILAKADSRFATRLLLGLGPERTGKLWPRWSQSRRRELCLDLRMLKRRHNALQLGKNK